MKASNSIGAYYQGLENDFVLHFQRVREDPIMEDIHQLRVSVKRLRALWSLMELATRGKWKKRPHYQLVRRLYRAAGRLREAQVNLSLLEPQEDEALAPYRNFLVQQQAPLLEALKKEARRFDITALERLHTKLHPRIASMEADIVVNAAAAFILKQNRKVRKLQGKRPSSRNLHDIRIQLKALQEVLGVMESLGTSPEVERLRDEVQGLNRDIGLWHDYSVLLEYMRGLRRKRKTNKGKKDRAILNDLDRQQEVRVTDLFSRIDSFVTRQQLRKIENLL